MSLATARCSSLARAASLRSIAFAPPSSGASSLLIRRHSLVSPHAASSCSSSQCLTPSSSLKRGLHTHSMQRVPSNTTSGSAAAPAEEGSTNKASQPPRATVVRSCSPPPSSAILSRLPGSTFHDSHETALLASDSAVPAMELALRIFTRVPWWVESLMHVRNRVVGLIGLHNEGAFRDGLEANKSPVDFRVGDRMGLFTLQHIAEDGSEVIFGVDDSHLDVAISVCKTRRPNTSEEERRSSKTVDESSVSSSAASESTLGAEYLAVTTVVREHNLVGRVYMLVVTPPHRFIAPAVLRNGYP